MLIIVVVLKKSITTCSETTAYGPLIYIDFYEINRPCFCTVTALFKGELLVTAQEIRILSCSTRVVVNGSGVFGCPLSQGTSVTFSLLPFQSLAVQAELSPSSSTGTFYQCLRFQQIGKSFFLKLFRRNWRTNIFNEIFFFYKHCFYYGDQNKL